MEAIHIGFYVCKLSGAHWLEKHMKEKHSWYENHTPESGKSDTKSEEKKELLSLGNDLKDFSDREDVDDRARYSNQ